MAKARQTRLNKPGPAALRRILYETADFHLDDARLAAVASAEAAGQDVEQRYAAELWHIEQCVLCATQYGELVADLRASFAEMVEDAAEIRPAAVYTAWLLQRLAAPLPELVEAIVTRLPFFFLRRPLTPADVSSSSIETASRQAAAATQQPAPGPAVVGAILEAVRADLGALGIYLAEVAQATWGRRVAVQIGVAPGGSSMRLSPASQSLAPAATIHEESARYLLGRTVPTAAAPDEVWRVTEQELTGVPPLHVELVAKRLSSLTCSLAVQIERAGYRVALRYGDEEQATLTDETGRALFSPLPIAALSQLTVTIHPT